MHAWPITQKSECW